MAAPQDEEENQVSLRLLESRIRSYTETQLPHKLGVLEQHYKNILRYQNEEDWDKLNIEQINANRTVQGLKTDVKSLEELRDQVKREDLEAFDSRLRGIRQRITSTIQAYGIAQVSDRMELETHSLASTQFEEMTVDEQSALIPREADATESWENLRTELLELNEVVKMLSSRVADQRQQVERIDSNVESAAFRVQDGRQELHQASRLRTLILPMGGALVGGVVGSIVGGGPIGALVGIRVGALTAAAAGAAGAIGGAYFGYKGQQKLTQEDEELTKKND